MKLIALFWGMLACAALAHAQNQVSWVASNGNDLNTCIRTSPCRSFSTAYDKTDAGGTIRAVDAADYGSVVITKSITIDGGTSGAFIAGAFSYPISVLSGASERVILRNLSIQVFGSQLVGILLTLGGQSTVNLENVSITSAANTQAILAVTNNADSGENTRVNLRHVNINALKTGVSIHVGRLTADRLTVNASELGVFLAENALSAVVRDSVLHASAGNAFQVTSNSGVLAKTVMLERSEFSESVQGVVTLQEQGGPPITIRLSNSVITDNVTGIALNGGTVISLRNNVIAGNQSDGPPPLTTSLK